MGSLFLFFSANECPLAFVLLSCAIHATLPRHLHQMTAQSEWNHTAK